MALNAVEMMCFFALNSGISIIKIGLKSGNPVSDFFHFGGAGMRYFIHFQLNLSDVFWGY